MWNGNCADLSVALSGGRTAHTQRPQSKYLSARRLRSSRQYCFRPIERAKRATSYWSPHRRPAFQWTDADVQLSSAIVLKGGHAEVDDDSAHGSADDWMVDDSTIVDITRRATARRSRPWNSIRRPRNGYIVSFAQWRYRNQWGPSEVRLLLVENFNQYPAMWTWNTVRVGNFWRP